MQPQQHLTFPELGKNAIASCMEDLSIPFTVEDIVKPTPERVLQALEAITEIILGVSREAYSAQSVSFEMMEMMESPELHGESVALMGFYRHLLRLCSEVGLHDFSIKDILKPERKRVILIFSAIINFIRFREERIQIFEKCTSQSEQLLDTRQTLEKQNQDLKQKIQVILDERARQEPEVKDLEEKMSVVSNELRALKQTHVEISEVIENLKKEKDDMNDKLKNNAFLITNLKQDSARLKSRIVKNPDAIREAISKMRASLSEEKSAVALSERKSRDMAAKLDRLVQIETDLLVCNGMLKGVFEEKGRLDEAKRLLEKEKDGLERKKSEVHEVDMKEQQAKRQLSAANEKLNRLQKHHEAKQTANQEKLSKLKEEYELVSAERAQSLAKADENDRLAKEMEERVKNLQNSMEIEFAELSTTYEELEKKFNSYQLLLEKNMSML